MSDFERSGMAAPKAGERWWVVAVGLGAQLSEWSQTCSDGKCGAAEKIATVDRIGHEYPASDALPALYRLPGRCHREIQV
jgi:hypothetical protein